MTASEEEVEKLHTILKNIELEDEKKNRECVSPPSIPVARKEVKKQSKREKIIDEILKTEAVYVEQLVMLQNLFRNPFFATLHQKGEVMTAMDFESIFSSSETILVLNKEFLHELKTRREEEWDEDTSTIGDIFLDFGSLLKLYGDYCSKLEIAFQTVARLKESSLQFVQILKLIEKLPDLKGLGLESFLSLPMQRVPRYVLLLEELLKATPSHHCDHELVKKALDKCKEVAREINESVRLREKREELIELAAQLEGYDEELVLPSRTLVKTGSMRKITTKFISEDFYILCSDVLLYAKRFPHYLQYKGTIELDTAWVRELMDSEFVKNVFQIITPVKSYTLFLESEEDKTEWITLIKKCIDKLVKKDPSLLKKRGEITMRRTHGTMDALLRKFFSFSPENFDHEFEDEFVMIDNDGSHYIKVDLSEGLDQEQDGKDIKEKLKEKNVEKLEWKDNTKEEKNVEKEELKEDAKEKSKQENVEKHEKEELKEKLKEENVDKEEEDVEEGYDDFNYWKI